MPESSYTEWWDGHSPQWRQLYAGAEDGIGDNEHRAFRVSPWQNGELLLGLWGFFAFDFLSVL